MRQFDFETPLLADAAPTCTPSRPSSRALAASQLRRRSASAIIGFAAFSLVGALSISYYCLTGLDKAGGPATPTSEPAIYEAKAVPRDDAGVDAQLPLGGAVNVPHAKSGAISAETEDQSHREQHHAPADGRRASAVNDTEPIRELYSFPELDAMQHAFRIGSAAALAGSVALQSNSAAAFAPDAEFVSVAPVPEPAEWSVAGAAMIVTCFAQRAWRRRHTHGRAAQG